VGAAAAAAGVTVWRGGTGATAGMHDARSGVPIHGPGGMPPRRRDSVRQRASSGPARPL